MWYLGWHFEATTDYLLQTLGQARGGRDLHFKCNPAKVYGCGRVVSIMVTVIKPENEIWSINFENGCINKIDAAAAVAVRSQHFRRRRYSFNWIFILFSYELRQRDAVTFEYIIGSFFSGLHIRSNYLFPLCLMFVYFFPIRRPMKCDLIPV